MPYDYTPIYRMLRNGQDITGRFSDRCVAIRVDYHSDGGNEEDRCEITLDDRDFAIARPEPGETITIEMGYAEIGLHDMGSFVIERVLFGYAPKSITLVGTASGSETELKSSIIQEFKGKTLGQLFQSFAQNGGLGAKVHPDIASKTIDYLNARGSSFQNIGELARHFGAVAKVVKGTLQVVPRDKGETVDGESRPIIILGPSHFGTYTVEHNTRSGFGSVQAMYREQGDFLTKFVGQDNPIRGVESTAEFIINRVFNTMDQADAAAKQQMQALNRSRGEAHLTLAQGDPWIADQQRMMIGGLRDGVNGSYVTSIVSHTYMKDQGIGTEILAKPPSDGDNYESLFEDLGEENRKQLFIDMGQSGEPLGAAILNRFEQGSVSGSLVNGLSPF